MGVIGRTYEPAQRVPEKGVVSQFLVPTEYSPLT